MRNALMAGALFVAGGLPGAAIAANELLDPAFGDGGFRLLDSTSGDRHLDVGIATCPGANGTEVVIGGQRGSGRITVARLLENGEFDSSFGDAGRVSFDVAPADFGNTGRALCLGNGRAVVARITFVTGTLHLFRIGSDGHPDPAFGGGQVVIDLAALPGGVAGMVIQGMDPAPNGEILLTGGSPLGGGFPANPFLIRLNADGSMRDARVLTDPGLGTRSTLSTAGYGSDGSLMLLGTTQVEVGGSFYARWFAAVLNGVDLGGGVEHFGEVSTTKTFVVGGRVARPGVLVAAAAHDHGLGPIGAYVPRILVFRRGTVADGVTWFDLPVPPAPMVPRGHTLVATDASHMLFASGLDDAFGMRWSAFYFSRIHIGDGANADGVDASFGSGGYSIARRDLADCSEDDNAQSFQRISLWRGRPVFVGDAVRECGSAEHDVVVGRLVVDRLFVDGFE